jgi:hypothetical protein
MNFPRLMIGTPCYGGMMHESYVRGLTALVVQLSSSGLPIHLSTVVNESLITRARNELVKNFLMSDCTHLLFIDADITFSPDDVFRLINHDKDVVVGAYPLKGLRWSNLEELKDCTNIEEVKRKVTEYVINFQFASEEDAMAGRLPVVEGLIEVKDAGTGFMCIKRNVFEKMIEEIPNLEYKKEVRFLMNEKDDGVRWAFFDCEIDKADGRYLSEDYLFCRRWQSLGGKIWLDPQITLSHTGTYTFQGHTFFEFKDESGNAVDKNELQPHTRMQKPKLIGG